MYMSAVLRACIYTGWTHTYIYSYVHQVQAHVISATYQSHLGMRFRRIEVMGGNGKVTNPLYCAVLFSSC